jgi:hypothetical protein
LRLEPQPKTFDSRRTIEFLRFTKASLERLLHLSLKSKYAMTRCIGRRCFTETTSCSRRSTLASTPASTKAAENLSRSAVGGVNGGLKVLVDDVQQNQGTQGHGHAYLGALKTLIPELVQAVSN